MHAGARIVRLDRTAGDDGGDEWKFEILSKFEEHRSMNYSADVQPCSRPHSSEETILSTSFYDKLLCLWKVRRRDTEPIL